MKGIILAAGKGTRLYPMTLTSPKPLVPVYDKPLIYYPLSVLIQMKINDILIIVPPGYENMFSDLLGDGSDLGISINYKVQEVPRGIADAFVVGREFIGDDSVVLLLGDNIFFNREIDSGFSTAFHNHVINQSDNAMVLGYRVNDPWRFGVVEFDDAGKVLSLEEKPIQPKSNYIVPGFYYYPNDVIDKVADIKPSARGELEITSINQKYLEEDRLYVRVLPNDSHWFDTGTADSLLEAANAIRDQQFFHNDYVGCVEVEACLAGYINSDQLLNLGYKLKSTNYGAHLVDFSNKLKNLQI